MLSAILDNFGSLQEWLDGIQARLDFQDWKDHPQFHTRKVRNQ